MTLKEKILSCHGNVKAKSAAIMCGCSLNQVISTWYSNNMFGVVKYPHRLAPR